MSTKETTGGSWWRDNAKGYVDCCETKVERDRIVSSDADYMALNENEARYRMCVALADGNELESLSTMEIFDRYSLTDEYRGAFERER
ncbi:MAG: hypothetical protein J6575_03560 [Bifidobacterium sp.]|nr:hypothetical protein [Bifidobacterium sp.]